ncbi:MAG: hypothetical protein AAF558_09155 [Verrucomicrobiota bacterium]
MTHQQIEPVASGFLPSLIGTLNPKDRSLDHLGLAPFPLQQQATQSIKSDRQQPESISPSAITKESYLDLMELIVREAATWINAHGAIIDPFENKEYAQTSPRFVAPAAILLHFGRLADLEAAIYQCMDYCCNRLAAGQAQSPDFWMREIMTAYFCLKGRAPKASVQLWEDCISSVIPEKTYWAVNPENGDLSSLHNWVIYSSSGEYLRYRAGLAPEPDSVTWGKSFFEKYMAAQLCHFTPNGMYKDPGNPITYDITSRLQIATALLFGYDGPLKNDLDELLRRGGLTTLLFMSPEGQCPYGGRSNQFLFNEAIIVALCEAEARRYHEVDPKLAGAFKRQAHRTSQFIMRWVTKDDPMRYNKNYFSLAENIGADAYAKVSCYGLLTASFLGLAAIFSEDEIDEASCPAEEGGYLLHLDDEFHKVIATCSGTHVSIDTCADLKYEATGLGRFTHEDCPIELGLNIPFTATPSYKVPEHLIPSSHFAIGPSWKTSEGEWINLAECSEQITSTVNIAKTSKTLLRWSIDYEINQEIKISEHYSLRAKKLDIRSKVTAPQSNGLPTLMRFCIPILESDGKSKSHIEKGKENTLISFKNNHYQICYLSDSLPTLESHCFANRNGTYRLLVLTPTSAEIELTLSLMP